MQETNRTASFYQVSVPALRPFLVYSQMLFGVEIRDLSWNAPYVGRYQGIVHNARFRPKYREIAWLEITGGSLLWCGAALDLTIQDQIQARPDGRACKA